jgi:hypothetical protein
MRAISISLVVLAGCGRIGFDAARTEDASSPADVAFDALAGCTTYTFDTLPPALEQFGSGSIMVNGQLRCDLPGPAGEAAGVRTAGYLDFTGARTSIEVIQLPSSTATFNGPGWHTDTESVHLFIISGMLRLETGMGVQVTDTYNPVQHRWLQIFDDGGALIRAATSPDGVTWNLFGGTGRFALDAAWLDVGSDAAANLAGPDTGVFDNLEICLR